MPTIGTFNCDVINWIKAPPFTHSSAFRQPGRNGNGHVLGPVYADSSALKSTHFIAGKSAEKALLDEAAALCGTSVNVSEVDEAGNPINTLSTYIESFKVSKANGCSGPGSTLYAVILDWVVYIPISI